MSIDRFFLAASQAARCRIFAALAGITGNTLQVIGDVRSQTVAAWSRSILLPVAGIPGAIYARPKGMAAGRPEGLEKIVIERVGRIVAMA